MPSSPAIRPTPVPEEASNALDQAFAELGLSTTSTSQGIRVNVGPKTQVLLQLEWLAVPTPDAVERRMDTHSGARTAIPLLIGNRIGEPVRELLRESGWAWLDRRGHIRIVAPGLYVDAPITATLPVEREDRNVLGTEVGLAVAVQLLLHPTTAQTIRPLAHAIGRSSSAVGAAMQELRKQSLIRSNGLPLTPELFWELSAMWRPKVTALARRPRLDHLDIATNVEPQDLAAGAPGWCVTNTIAAHSWGAPLTTTAETPPSFLVPTLRDLRTASAAFGTPDRFDQRAASIIVAPVPSATRLRYLPAPRSKRTSRQWPLAHPLFVALELSRDKARGQEVLEGWTPIEPFHRVW